MRFDLELKVVSQLTQDGLDNLSEMLYGDSPIIPMFWDQTSVTDKIKLNKGTIDYTNYNNKNNIDDSFISSGVDMSKDDLSFVKNIVFGSTVVPIFNNGSYSVNKSNYFLSKNNIVKPFSFVNERYECEVDDGVALGDIIVSTTSFVHPGYNKTKKNFVAVRWDQMYYEDYQKRYDEGYVSGDALEETLNYIFKNNASDYKFCLFNNKVYLSCNKITYTNQLIGNVGDTKNKMFVLPEFPFSNLEIGNCPASSYVVRGGVVIFKQSSSPTIGTNLYATYDVVPYISYVNRARSTDDDYVYFNTNMHPKLLNYKNGTLCLGNSFGDSDIPVNLNLTTNKDVVFGSEPFRATAKLTGIGDVAVPNKTVKLEIVSNNAIFVDNNGESVNKTTLADGTIMADVVAKADKIGYYIQKEWVNGNKITVPFVINTLGPNTVYTYFITSDDPILGKKYSSIYDQDFNEYYVNSDLSSYEMNGRKIAYVSLQDNNGELTSRFIKPTSIEIKYNQPSTFRNLYYNNNVEIRTAVPSGTFLRTASASGEYDTGILPNNRVDLYSFSASATTEITFGSPIPTGGSIAGFWLITDGAIMVKASYNDDNVILDSNVTTTTLQNIKTESSFILNKYNTSQGASQLNSFGYLTISEYLKNPFGLNAFSVYCMHSDCIYKKCIHPDPTIRKNFVLDEGKVGCIHNKEWDAENWTCPGQNAHLVNPFIMHLEGN